MRFKLITSKKQTQNQTNWTISWELLSKFHVLLLNISAGYKIWDCIKTWYIIHFFNTKSCFFIKKKWDSLRIFYFVRCIKQILYAYNVLSVFRGFVDLRSSPPDTPPRSPSPTSHDLLISTDTFHRSSRVNFV